MKRIGMFVGGALVLFVLIAQPENSATWLKETMGGLGHGAQALVTFVRNLFPV